jgi:hypothetical protein
VVSGHSTEDGQYASSRIDTDVFRGYNGVPLVYTG